MITESNIYKSFIKNFVIPTEIDQQIEKHRLLYDIAEKIFAEDYNECYDKHSFCTGFIEGIKYLEKIKLSMKIDIEELKDILCKS